MAELADALDSKSSGSPRAGSSPASGINKFGSVKNFVALVKNGSFLVRIIDMTILIEKEFIYGSSKRPNPTDYYRK